MDIGESVVDLQKELRQDRVDHFEMQDSSLDMDRPSNSILLNKQNTLDKLMQESSSPDFQPPTITFDEGGEPDSNGLPPISEHRRSPTPKDMNPLDDISGSGQPSINAV